MRLTLGENHFELFYQTCFCCWDLKRNFAWLVTCYMQVGFETLVSLYCNESFGIELKPAKSKDDEIESIVLKDGDTFCSSHSKQLHSRPTKSTLCTTMTLRDNEAFGSMSQLSHWSSFCCLQESIFVHRSDLASTLRVLLFGVTSLASSSWHHRD